MKVETEIKAMGDLAALLEPLDLRLRERVLRWGRETLVSEVTVDLTSAGIERINGELDALVEGARRLGVSGPVLLKALAAYHAAGDAIPEAVEDGLSRSGSAG